MGLTIRITALVSLVAIALAGCGGSDDTPVGVDPRLIGSWHLTGLTQGGDPTAVDWDKTLTIGGDGAYTTNWYEHGLRGTDTGRFNARNSKYLQVVATTTDPQPTQYMEGIQHEGTYQISDTTLVLTHDLYEFPDVEVVETYERGAGAGMQDRELVGTWRLTDRFEDGVEVPVHWTKLFKINADSTFRTDWDEHGLKSYDQGMFRAGDARYSMLITASNYPGSLDRAYYLGPYLVSDTTLAIAVEEEDGHVTTEYFSREP